MNKKNIAIIISALLVLLVVGGILFFRTNDNQKRNDVENKNEVYDQFSETEKNIINLVQTKAKELDYMDENNMKFFEVTDVWGYGYFESKRDIRYVQVNFNFECKDGTNSCITIPGSSYADDVVDFSAMFVEIDLNDDQYLEFCRGISVNINSDFVQENKIPDYYKYN